MASIRTTLELANQQFLAAIKQSEEAVKNFQTNVKNVGTAAEGAFGGLAAAAAGLALGLIATGKEVMAFADEMTDIATAADTTVGNILALGAALQANGGHADKAGRMMFDMSKKIEEANQGNTKMVASFERLGVSIQDLGSMGATEIRDKLIKGIAEIPDAAERAAKGFAVFGKSAMNVDWTKLADSIDENNKKYSQHEAALKSAGDAYDNLAKIAMDTKIAFAEAFKPAFDMIKQLNPSIDDLTIKFKLMGTALVVITGAAIARGVWALVGAFQALRVAVMANPLLAIASVLATVGVAAATYFGAFDSGTKDIEDNSKATEDNTDATKRNSENKKRDQELLLAKYAQQRESLEKITQSFNLQNQAIERKLKLELDALTLTEEQKKSAQQVSEIEVGRDKALLDLKEKYNNLDVDSRGKQKRAYEEQAGLIKRNADLEISAARELIALQDTRKKQILDRVNGLKTLGSAEEEVFKLQQQMTPKSGAEQIQNDVEINAALERRKLLLEKIIATNKGISLYDVNEGLLGSTEDLSFAVQTLVNRYKDLPGVVAMTKEEFIKLRQENAEQLKAIDESARAIGDQKQKVFDQQRSFSYGWEKAFKEYADNATNSSRIASNLFTKAMSGMEDALVNFAKTGKFTWKNFVNMMLEELLRAQIQSTFAKMLGGMRGGMGGGGGSLLGGLFGGIGKMFSGGSGQQGPTPDGGNLSGGGGIFSGIGKLFGFANGGSVVGNSPILVGERGPEMFIPGNSGSIVPNDKLSGGSNVTYNINAVDAMSFKAMIARDPQFLYAVTQQGAKSLPGAR
jgi:hypothetical protein